LAAVEIFGGFWTVEGSLTLGYDERDALPPSHLLILLVLGRQCWRGVVHNAERRCTDALMGLILLFSIVAIHRAS
jgi:hypothetical protein